MTKVYDVSDWYWIVGGDQTKAFSSAVGDYVQASNQTYQNWLAAGGVATKIDTEQNLGAVLAPYQVRPALASVLDGYTGALADSVIVLAAFKILFNHENRLRACERALGLNGSPQNITPAQARSAVKALM